MVRRECSGLNRSHAVMHHWVARAGKGGGRFERKPSSPRKGKKRIANNVHAQAGEGDGYCSGDPTTASNFQGPMTMKPFPRYWVGRVYVSSSRDGICGRSNSHISLLRDLIPEFTYSMGGARAFVGRFMLWGQITVRRKVKFGVPKR